MLRTIVKSEIPADCFEPVDPKALEQAKVIVDGIRARGEVAFVEFATNFKDIAVGESYVATKDELKAAFDGLSEENKGVLTRTVTILTIPYYFGGSF